MRNTSFATAAASMTWLAACAAPLPGATPAVASSSASVSGAVSGASSDSVSNSASASAELRVLVKLATASADTAAIAAQVGTAAGTNARYLAASSPQWHALALRCADVQTCEAAFQRLSANKAAFEVVQRDERKRIVTP